MFEMRAGAGMRAVDGTKVRGASRRRSPRPSAEACPRHPLRTSRDALNSFDSASAMNGATQMAGSNPRSRICRSTVWNLTTECGSGLEPVSHRGLALVVDLDVSRPGACFAIASRLSNTCCAVTRGPKHHEHQPDGGAANASLEWFSFIRPATAASSASRSGPTRQKNSSSVHCSLGPSASPSASTTTSSRSVGRRTCR